MAVVEKIYNLRKILRCVKTVRGMSLSIILSLSYVLLTKLTDISIYYVL